EKLRTWMSLSGGQKQSSARPFGDGPSPDSPRGFWPGRSDGPALMAATPLPEHRGADVMTWGVLVLVFVSLRVGFLMRGWWDDLAEIGQRKLATLASIMKTAAKFDDGSKLMQEAAQAYRDGIAAILTQPIVTGDDPEGRIEALARPFEDSMSSPELSVNGSKV